MTARKRSRTDDRQGDLFMVDATRLYPVRAPEGVVTATEFRLRIAQAISESMHDYGKPRAVIAFEMTQLLGEEISEHMLNAWASPAREGHDITVTRLRGLVKVTGALWLWEIATEGQGVTILAGHDAIYAQQGLLQNQIKSLQTRLRALSSTAPVQPATSISTRGRRGK